MNTTTPASTGTIVVGVDGSKPSTEALVWAATEADLQGRELTIVHAEKAVSASQQAWLASAGISPGEIVAQVLEEAREVVDHARARALTDGPDSRARRSCRQATPVKSCWVSPTPPR